MAFFGSFLLGKALTALQLSVRCAQLRSTHFPHSFRFPSASSSRHLLSFLCETVPIWNKLPSSVISSTSLSSFRSAVRRYFVSDMFSYGLSRSWFRSFSLILFVGFTIFISIYMRLCFNNFSLIVSLFSSLIKWTIFFFASISSAECRIGKFADSRSENECVQRFPVLMSA